MNIKNMLETIMADEVHVEKVINAAGGVIARSDDNNRINVLIIKRSENDHWPNVWEFPRGKCDKTPNEDLLKCLTREIKEETGLDVTPIEKIDVYEYLADGGKRKTFCHNYLCMLKDPNQEVKLSKEHDSFKWISEVGEVELMITNEQKKTLQKVLNTERSIVSYPEDSSKSVETVEEYLNKLNEFEPATMAALGAVRTGVSAVMYSVMAIKLAYEFYKKNFTAAAKRCADLSDSEKSICLLDAKARAKAAEISKLKGGMANCAKDRNPQKCKLRLNNRLNQSSAEYNQLRQRIHQLTGSR